MRAASAMLLGGFPTARRANAASLAGVANSADGTSLAFAFYAIGDGSTATRDAVETLATAVYACGDNLSTN